MLGMDPRAEHDPILDRPGRSVLMQYRPHARRERTRLIARFRPQASRHVPSFVYIEPWDRLYRSVAFQGVI